MKEIGACVIWLTPLPYAALCATWLSVQTFQSCAAIYTLLTTGIHGGRPTASRPLILCPSSLVTNWGKELTKWLGDRVEPVLLDDTRAANVKDVLSRFGAGETALTAPHMTWQFVSHSGPLLHLGVSPDPCVFHSLCNRF